MEGDLHDGDAAVALQGTAQVLAEGGAALITGCSPGRPGRAGRPGQAGRARLPMSGPIVAASGLPSSAQLAEGTELRLGQRRPRRAGREV